MSKRGEDRRERGEREGTMIKRKEKGKVINENWKENKPYLINK